MSDINTKIAVLEDCLKNVLPEPWEFTTEQHAYKYYGNRRYEVYETQVMCKGRVLDFDSTPLLRYVTAMHNYLPELIAEIRRLHTVLNIELHGGSIDWKLRVTEADARAEKAEEELESAREWGRKKHEQLEYIKCARRDDLAYAIERAEKAEANAQSWQQTNLQLSIQLAELKGRAEKAEKECVACQDIAGQSAAYWKDKSEQMQAERDVLAELCATLKIADGEKPTERWCPKEYSGTCMQCCIVDPGEDEWCEQGIGDTDCWLKWAVQEAVRKAGKEITKPCNKTCEHYKAKQNPCAYCVHGQLEHKTT